MNILAAFGIPYSLQEERNFKWGYLHRINRIVIGNDTFHPVDYWRDFICGNEAVLYLI